METLPRQGEAGAQGLRAGAAGVPGCSTWWCVGAVGIGGTHAMPQVCPLRRGSPQPPAWTLAPAVTQGTAFGGLSPGVAQRGHSSDMQGQRLAKSWCGTHAPPRPRGRIQAAPPSETATDSRASHLCVLGSRLKQAAGRHLAGLPTWRALLKEVDEKRQQLGAPTPQAQGWRTRGGAADTQYLQPSEKQPRFTPGGRHHCPSR